MKPKPQRRAQKVRDARNVLSCYQPGMGKSLPNTCSSCKTTMLTDMELQHLMFGLWGFGLAVDLLFLFLFYPLGGKMFSCAAASTSFPFPPPPLALFVVLRVKPRAFCMLDENSTTELYP